MQLKLEYDYFKSYLKRLSDYDSDKCDYNNNSIQSSAYLLFSCNKYTAKYNKIKDKLKTSNLSLKLLLITRDKIQAVFNFLKNSEIVKRN